MSLTHAEHPSNKTTFDISSVAYATLYYRNQRDSHHLDKLPKYHTVNGVIFDAKAIAAHVSGFAGETMLDRAKRRGLLDIWTPVIKLTLKNGHKLVYEGERALSIKKAWDSRIFGKK